MNNIYFNINTLILFILIVIFIIINRCIINKNKDKEHFINLLIHKNIETIKQDINSVREKLNSTIASKQNSSIDNIEADKTIVELQKQLDDLMKQLEEERARAAKERRKAEKERERARAIASTAKERAREAKEAERERAATEAEKRKAEEKRRKDNEQKVKLLKEQLERERKTGKITNKYINELEKQLKIAQEQIDESVPKPEPELIEFDLGEINNNIKNKDCQQKIQTYINKEIKTIHFKNKNTNIDTEPDLILSITFEENKILLELKPGIDNLKDLFEEKKEIIDNIIKQVVEKVVNSGCNEHFTGTIEQGPCPSPCPAPCPALCTYDNDETEKLCPAPCPVPCPAPCPALTTVEESGIKPTFIGKTDDFDVNVPEVKTKINEILKHVLNKTVSPSYTYYHKKLVIKVSEIEYENLDSVSKKNIEDKLRKYLHSHFQKKYKQTKHKKYNILENQIQITFMSGSTVIIVTIVPSNKVSQLTEDEKEQLEFYNFMMLLNRGQVPMSEREYVKHRYTVHTHLH